MVAAKLMWGLIELFPGEVASFILLSRGGEPVSWLRRHQGIPAMSWQGTTNRHSAATANMPWSAKIEPMKFNITVSSRERAGSMIHNISTVCSTTYLTQQHRKHQNYRWKGQLCTKLSHGIIIQNPTDIVQYRSSLAYCGIFTQW